MTSESKDGDGFSMKANELSHLDCSVPLTSPLRINSLITCAEAAVPIVGRASRRIRLQSKLRIY